MLKLSLNFNNRCNSLKTSWTFEKVRSCPKENRHLLKNLSFSEAVDIAVKHMETFLFNDFSNLIKSYQDELSYMAKINPEIRHYYETGNCGQGNSKAASVNPTFIQTATGKWLINHMACPFHGYLPIPLQELESRSVKKGIIGRYCKDELKKLLTGFRKRMDKIVFYFHPCDALAFCYGDLPYKFDIIDTSTLADDLGLANLLNAAARKLLSDESLLITESIYWFGVAPTVAQYVQETLFCPLSLVPTLYGFRLMEKVEWGQESPRAAFTLNVMPARLRWKKTMPFDRVPLVFTPSLKVPLMGLMNACAHIPSCKDLTTDMRRSYYSPLTFCYVLSDLIRRGCIRDLPL